MHRSVWCVLRVIYIQGTKQYIKYFLHLRSPLVPPSSQTSPLGDNYFLIVGPSWTPKKLFSHNITLMLDVTKLIYSLQEEKINRWLKAAVDWIPVINQHIDAKQIRHRLPRYENRKLLSYCFLWNFWATAAAAESWRDICNLWVATFLI